MSFPLLPLSKRCTSIPFENRNRVKIFAEIADLEGFGVATLSLFINSDNL